jgi:predicted dehydrogenase
VLGEKPISNEIPKAEQMVAFAKEKRIPYGVNLNHRFTPPRARQGVAGPESLRREST